MVTSSSSERTSVHTTLPTERTGTVPTERTRSSSIIQQTDGSQATSTAVLSGATASSRSTSSTTTKPTRKQLWRHRQHIQQVSDEPKSANKPTVVLIEPAELSIAERFILTKGLSFVPSKIYPSQQIIHDLDNFQNQLINRATPFAYDIPRHPLIASKARSTITTISDHAQDAIDQYIGHCKTSIKQCNRETTKRNNLSTHERKILNSLKKRTDIIIKKADKGDTIVVETTDNYIQDGLAHLSNEKFYHRTPDDINSTIHLAINKFLNNAHHHGLIDKETFQYLTPPINYRTPLIYFLKKLHKDPISVRPIVSHVNSPTSNISAFIDTLLKPIVKEIPHILLNSLQLVKDLQTISISEATTLVTLDVVSLYPNIPIEESIHIILKYIEEQNNPTHPPICIINTLLTFVLNYNCFNFGDLFFLQVHGIAMGTKLAPNYANLFMANFENNHVFNYHIQPQYYKRYIDDIFFIWNDTSDELDHFINNHLNTVHPTIKFTKTTSDAQITYLDLDIYIKDKTIHTKTHFKSTNTFSYLHGHSNHPTSTFKGVYKGENIRILRNTSEDVTYKNTFESIKNHFKTRKYPAHLINSPVIPFKDRDLYLHCTNKSSNYPVTFITTFDPTISIKNHLLEDWPRLSSDRDLRDIFPEPPKTSYRHSPNLSQLLVRAKLNHSITTNIRTYSQPPSIATPSYPAKNIKCRNQQCGTCIQLTDRSYFSSYQTKHYFPINDIYSCDTTGSIYLLECKLCNKQYIGESHTTLRNRMTHHRNMSKSATNRPLYNHLQYHQSDFSIYSITIIDRITDTIQRKQKEMDYIKLLKTKVPFGFNVINKT